ncbi:hypothetical protein Unana1_06512 [Umbelopsis nana]
MSMEPNEDTPMPESVSLESASGAPHAASTQSPTAEVLAASHSSGTPLETENNNQAISLEEQRMLNENEDYQGIRKALNVLLYQLQQARKDVKVLVDMKEKALSDPVEFVNKLKRKVKLEVPPLQKVVCVQEVDWGRFQVPPEGRVARQLENLASSNARLPSHERKVLFKNILDLPMSTLRNGPASNASYQKISSELEKAARVMEAVGTTQSRATSVSDLSDKESDEESMANGHKGKGHGKRRASAVALATRHGQDPPSPASSTVSSQVADELTPRSLLARASWLSETPSDTTARRRTGSPESVSRSTAGGGDSGDGENLPVTHNLPWSDEEQQRLEELLQIYPDEPVQAQRFNKISAALGTRTPRQVGSRVQKYFIKLAKNGLPVPGRITIPPSSLPKSQRPNPKPKSRTDFKKPNPKARSETDSVVRTSGTSYNVHLPGSTSSVRVSGARYITATPAASVMMTDHEFDTSSLVGSNAYPSLGQQGLTQPSVNEKGEAIHYGFACDACGDEPIIGIRYKCAQCDISEEVDLCEKCHSKGTFSNDHHPSSHSFEAIATADPLPYYADDDYTGDSHLGEFNYLG